MSVARVPDSRRLQSVFVIVKYIRLSNTSHFPPITISPQPFPPHDIFTFSHIPPITISPPSPLPPHRYLPFYVTHLHKTSHKSPNIKFQKIAFYLKMSKKFFFYFLFSLTTTIDPPNFVTINVESSL